MKITMDDSRLTDITQLKAFLKGVKKFGLSLRGSSIEKKYAFINRIVIQLKYLSLRKKDKHLVIIYLRKLTGYKPAQLYRLVNRAVKGKLHRQPYQRVKSHRIYNGQDIKLLEETDKFHHRLNALATKEILRREVEVFGHSKYQTIAKVSVSHVANLREHPIYKNHWINHTKPRVIPIGLTQPPQNHGRPGSIRIDTVHQADIYYINAVDEITQWEMVVCVPTISEQFLKPALEKIINQCPFIIFNFHSDRGSEYINYIVAQLLNKLHILQTKSRSRKPGDNALVETKNGAVIRKNMGWEHLDREVSSLINHYCQHWFNPYLNYHRPSLFANKVFTDKKGRQRKIYDEAMVPYEKLKEIMTNKDTSFLKKGITIESLDKIAYQYSDNEFAQILREKERKLHATIHQQTLTKNGSRQKIKT